jgi:signal transduction histidine kinase
MLIKKTSVAEYHIIGEPKKIMAYVPIELNENFWILSISTYLPSVITNVSDNFLLFFLLSSVAIILISIMGFILYTINLKRIRAEESGRFLEESRSFQEKMNHAAKLASIGELVDNVAHEINTPTGIISAEADVLYLQECNPKNCCEELDIIKEQTRRIRNYTKSLLNYSRRMPFMPERNNIIELIDECIFLLSPRIRANQVHIVKNIENNIPEFIFDKGRIEQVIINILNNAIDSIDDQNEKTISVSLNEKTEIDSENKFIRIAIADRGIGIPVENIDKIFDPFFSTKSTDQGTGLGLSISKAIIKRHNGNLIVESKINEGTTFIVELPLKNNGRYD